MGPAALSTCQATGLLGWVQNAQEQGLTDGQGAGHSRDGGKGVPTFSLSLYINGYVVASLGLRRGKDTCPPHVISPSFCLDTGVGGQSAGGPAAQAGDASSPGTFPKACSLPWPFRGGAVRGPAPRGWG